MNNKFTLHKTKNPTDDGWHQIGGPINSEQIIEITDTEGRKASRGLTSVPSPFARMHLFESAFDMVNREGHLEETVYHRMVSQCLDMLELMFNYGEYTRARAPLSITKWSRHNEIQALLNSKNPNQRLLGRTLELYLQQEGAGTRFEGLKDIYLVRYNHQLIGGSSPLTLFFSSPDLAPIDIKTPKGDRYFEKSLSLSERAHEFQVYLYKLFKAQPNLRGQCKTMFEYIVRNRDEYAPAPVRDQIFSIENSSNPVFLSEDYDPMRDDEGNLVNINGVELVQKRQNLAGISQTSDFVIQPSREVNGTSPLVLKQGFDRAGMTYIEGAWNPNTQVPANDPLPLSQRILPGSHVVYPYLTSGDFLEDYILRLPYGVNEEFFLTGKHNASQTPERFFPFMLPVRREYFDYFTLQDLQRSLSFEIKESSLAGERVIVRLTIPVRKGEIVYEKTYYQRQGEYLTREKRGDEGEIVSCNMGMGVFPFYKVQDQPAYNSFYKLMLIDVDDREETLHEEYDLKFYAGNTEIQNGVKLNTRRTKREERVGTSMYYELDRSFDYIEVYPQRIRRAEIRGLVIPKWKPVSIGGKAFSFAVDFGTTNTHVAYSDDQHLMPRPFNIGEEDLQVVMLNRPHEGESSERKMTASRYTRGLNNLREALILQEREFLPSIIGSEWGSGFHFPLRTATSETEHFSIEPSVPLGNINIAFSFEKERLDRKAPVHTHLKWNEALDVKGHQRIEAFFKELLLMIKNKIILNGGDPAKARITWFTPLSMGDFQKEQFAQIWERLFKEVMTGAGKLMHMTESVAPYYFLRRTNQLVAGENIINIDIGGGTTDVLFFQDAVPRYGSSVKFGGNSLWGAGFNAHEFHDKTNGFLEAFKKRARKDAASTRKTVATGESMEEFYNDLIHYGIDSEIGLASSDIISFLFNYDEQAVPQLKFADFLRNDKHLKVILLLHYSAIIYHIGQILNYIKLHKDANVRIPRYLVFSGKGSLYINALGGAQGKGIRLLTRHILQQVCGTQGLEVPERFELILNQEPKEATANGGVLAVQDEEYDIQPLILAGLPNADVENRKIRYNEIDTTITQGVLQNIEQLLEIVFNQEEVNLKNYFGIDTDLDLIRKSLIQHGRDGLQEGLSRYAGRQESLEESLFFYPLVHSLFKLSKELNTNYYV
jgi:hypothetical protein